MEKLLLHGAVALENGNVTLSQQIMWVLNNYASSEGDTNQRLTYAFLKALVARATNFGSPFQAPLLRYDKPSTQLSITDLACFVDLTPWYRFGFCVANSAITEAVRNCTSVHIVDLGVSHCMQYPTLIDLLSKRPKGPPLLKLTVISNPAGTATSFPSPLLSTSYDEIGLRLVNFARTRHVPFEFRVVPAGIQNLLLHLHPSRRLAGSEEALIVNCQMMLHYLPDETVCKTGIFSFRDDFLSAMRELQPSIFIMVDEDADLTSTNLLERMKSAMEYFWIPLDAVESVLPKASLQRQRYESDVRLKIENVVACEGFQRVERLEPRGRWSKRMRNARFQAVRVSDETFGRAKRVLADHAAGWGVKREDDPDGGGGLALTWKGHNVVFATVWTPSCL